MRLCEVDVAKQSGLACAGKQREQMRTFSLPTAAANQNDQSGIGTLGGEGQKVVPVAGDKEQSVFVSMAEHVSILRIHRQRLAQFGYFMALLAQHLSRIRGDIVIEEELHNPSARPI